MGLRDTIERNKWDSGWLLIALVFLVWTALAGDWIMFVAWICLATSDVIGIALDDDRFEVVGTRALLAITALILLAISFFA